MLKDKGFAKASLTVQKANAGAGGRGDDNALIVFQGVDDVGDDGGDGITNFSGNWCSLKKNAVLIVEIFCVECLF